MKGTLLKLTVAATVVAATVVSAESAQALIVSGTGGRIPAVNSGGQGAPNSIFQSTINIADSFSVTGVSTLLSSFEHTYAGDLAATLTHNGITATLFDRPGSPPGFFGESENFGGNYNFADGFGLIPEEFPTDPLASGNYGSTTPLAAFIGSNSSGAWTLRIEDFAGGDVGNLGEWSLTLDGDSITPVPTPAAVLPALFGMGAATVRKKKKSSEATQKA